MLSLVLFLLILALLPFGFFALQQVTRQVHKDPRIAEAWVEGVTYGPHLSLDDTDTFHRLLLKFGIHLGGRPAHIQSQFSGTPGSLELWLGSRSLLPHAAPIICHRVGITAFLDNYGQEYHGFLDIQPNGIFGIYLPGYDHSAYTLTCTLHWLPLNSDRPVSKPMRFTISLPRSRRVLPYARRLGPGPSYDVQSGIRVAISHVQLSAPRLLGDLNIAQRVITFHLLILGGQLDASNADTVASVMADPFSTNPLRRPAKGPAPDRLFQIFDPYGYPLLPRAMRLSPMMSLDQTHPMQDRDGLVWVAPVNGAGQSTDTVRFQFYVRPARPGSAPVLFNIIAPVQHDLKL